jgi:hypothetical protein
VTMRQKICPSVSCISTIACGRVLAEMARRPADLYSRIMAWMKIILPMGGLAILSSLFLFSKSHQPGEVIPGFEGGFSEIAGKERLSGPKFAGMTDSGIAIQLSAAQASPRIAGGAIFDATDLSAEVETRNGDRDVAWLYDRDRGPDNRTRQNGNPVAWTNHR